MVRKAKTLLMIDGIINLALGMLLLLFPVGIPKLLGIPESHISFYPTILGGVIFGIGLALLIERYGFEHKIRGLGLGGAIVINICGALVLLIWLIVDPFELPVRGYVILWLVAVLGLLAGIGEFITKSWRY